MWAMPIWVLLIRALLIRALPIQSLPIGLLTPTDLVPIGVVPILMAPSQEAELILQMPTAHLPIEAGVIGVLLNVGLPIHLVPIDKVPIQILGSSLRHGMPIPVLHLYLYPRVVAGSALVDLVLTSPGALPRAGNPSLHDHPP